MNKTVIMSMLFALVGFTTTALAEDNKTLEQRVSDLEASAPGGATKPSKAPWHFIHDLGDKEL